jgi:hypothetical protein
MLTEPDVNSDRLMDMIEFLMKQLTVRLEHGRIIVFLTMHFISFKPHIYPNISIMPSFHTLHSSVVNLTAFDLSDSRLDGRVLE